MLAFISITRRLRRVATCGAMLTLTGCVAPYAPYMGDDAGKVRITLATGPLFSSVAGNYRRLEGGKCGEPMRFPQMFPYAEPRRDPASSQMPPPPAYPRTEMFNSPDPMRSDVVELRLSPGRYQVLLAGGNGPSLCAISSVVEIERERQYQLDFSFDVGARKCYVSAKRLQEQQQGEPRWQPLPLARGEACPSS